MTVREHIGMIRAGLWWCVAVALSMVLCGCVSTVGGTAVAEEPGQRGAPPAVEPLDVSRLDNVMLPIDELNAIVGSSQMVVTSSLDEMTDSSHIAMNYDCLGALYAAEESVYAGSGWTAVLDQVASEPRDDFEHWVEQTAVLYKSAERAQEFFDTSAAAWADCGGAAVQVDDGESVSHWTVDELVAENNSISQRSTELDGWTCQHTMGVAANLIVEAFACSNEIGEEADTIAAEMLANAANS